MELDGAGDGAQWNPVQHTSPVPEARWKHVTAPIDESSMVIFGGIGSKNKRFNDVWVLDIAPDIPCWTEKKVTGDPPCPRGHHSGTMIDDQVLIFSCELLKLWQNKSLT
jgi:hypothetical protein